MSYFQKVVYTLTRGTWAKAAELLVGYYTHITYKFEKAASSEMCFNLSKLN